jgi:mono/diheme cytochrome c family protein
VRVAALALLIGCSQGSSAPAPTVAPAPAEKPIEVAVNPAQLELVAQQIEAGRLLFADHCASCHGDTGQGTDDGPQLTGKHALPVQPAAGAKRDVPFRSGADVYAFVAKNMPADDPGTLMPSHYDAVVAFTLSENGIKLDKPFAGSVAQLIVVNP